MLTSPLRVGAEAKYRRRDLEKMITEVSGVRAGSRSNSFEMSTTGTQEVSVPVHQAARLLLDSRCRLAAHLPDQVLDERRNATVGNRRHPATLLLTGGE